MIVADTSGLLAALDRRAKQHRLAKAVIESAPSPLLLSPFVLAELDYLVSTRLSHRAMLPVLEDVAEGAYDLVEISPADVAEARAVMARYPDQQIGLTDASLVVIAKRYGTTRVLTLDERHFRVLRPESGDAFTLLPADEAAAGHWISTAGEEAG